ncbi:ribonuclease H-like domain-containing protein, partial [Tanacetum coccineum]
IQQPEVNEYGPRNSSLKTTTVFDRESNNSKENTDDSLKQQQKTDSSIVKSPFKVDKDWKEKFFCPANQVREEEPKKSRERWRGCNFVFNNKACFICGSFDHIQYSCPNVHKHMVPRAVLMKTGLKTVNTARPINTVRSVNTGRPFSTARSFNTIRPLVLTI